MTSVLDSNNIIQIFNKNKGDRDALRIRLGDTCSVSQRTCGQTGRAYCYDGSAR